MHFICTPIWTKIYSCKKWVLHCPVKTDRQQPTGLLQPLQVPKWKWEEITIDFIKGLPRTQSGYDSIWAMVDRLTKVSHFITVKATYSGP
jgi:hypothetical protein